ncbi:MAG TPA: hypothetical protein VIV11_14570 [Kofleriaceae bacterium]
MRSLVLVLALASTACSKGKPDDCAIVRDKPAEAMAELSKRYPNNPVKVAETIEKCVAPTGDECDRIAKIVTAIPAMAPQIATPKPFDYAKTCREAPSEFRRCLLPSYMLAHADECREIVTKPITKIEIQPRGPSAGDAADCGFVSIYISEDGTWLATGRDDKARCFAPRKGKALDHAWLEAQLRKAKEHECGPSSAELAGDDAVLYQEMIETLDIAIKAGFMDTGVASPAELAVPLASASTKGAATECPTSVIPHDPTPAGSGTATAPRDPPPTGASDKLAKAPVLVITRDKLTLNAGGTSTEIMSVADAQKATKLDALTKALPPTKDGLLILQADQSTPSAVINRVVTTAKAAGYDNILFAVKNR